MATLLVITPLIASIAALILIATYVILRVAMRPRLDRNSKIFAAAWAERVKRIQEALGGIRNILLDRLQPSFESGFERAAGELRRAVTANSCISYFPRVVMEVVAMALIARLVWYLASRPAGLVAMIPTLGAVAACGQRLLPLLQSAYFAWSQMRGNEESLHQVGAMLELPDHADPVAPAPLRCRFPAASNWSRSAFSFNRTDRC
jgi:ATP-binding cassette subfamily B protein